MQDTSEHWHWFKQQVGQFLKHDENMNPLKSPLQSDEDVMTVMNWTIDMIDWIMHCFPLYYLQVYNKYLPEL